MNSHDGGMPRDQMVTKCSKEADLWSRVASYLGRGLAPNTRVPASPEAAWQRPSPGPCFSIIPVRPLSSLGELSQEEAGQTTCCARLRFGCSHPPQHDGLFWGFLWGC